MRHGSVCLSPFVGLINVGRRTHVLTFLLKGDGVDLTNEGGFQCLKIWGS